MTPDQILKHIQVDSYSSTPKYLQVTNAIQSAIEKGKIRRGDVLPSLNELSFTLDVSKDTAEKAYKRLKCLGILGSVPGKGYFIERADIKRSLKVCMIFNKLSAHKKIIYDSFVQVLGHEVGVDFYVYNNDYALFKKIFNERKEDYSHYVVIPHFVEGGESAHEILNQIPKEKLILLDKILPGVTGEYAAAYENFEKDIYNALEEAVEELRSYQVLKILFPKKSYFPYEIIKGFRRFCAINEFPFEVIDSLETNTIEEGDLYIILMEDDLVHVLEGVQSQELKIGSQVGIISYNETPVKKFIMNGLTTMSTDFQKMGAIAAQLLLDGRHDHVEVPFSLIKRASLKKATSKERVELVWDEV